MRAALLVMALAACAGPAAQSGSAAQVGAAAAGTEGQRIRLDPVMVLQRPDPLTQLDIYDAEKLFHMAGEAERKTDFDLARRVYHKLLDEFSTSSHAVPATFNLALLYERGGRWAEAVELYRRLAIAEVPSDDEGRRTYIDANFRAAVCYGKLADWWHSVAAFDRVLELTDLDAHDRLEAMTGRGIALHEAGESEVAETQFSGVLRYYQDSEQQGPVAGRELVAEAAFRMGDIARDRYVEVRLEMPVELLRERLENKCQHLLSAQNRYLRAVRFGDAHTVAAAGFRIGALYESLHDDVLALAPPDDLDGDQKRIYDEEVRGRVRVLLEKALVAYEKALMIGKRASTAQDWNERLEKAVARLRAILLSG